MKFKVLEMSQVLNQSDNNQINQVKPQLFLTNRRHKIWKIVYSYNQYLTASLDYMVYFCYLLSFVHFFTS